LVLFRDVEQTPIRDSGFGLGRGLTIVLVFDIVIAALVYLLGSIGGLW
jgi:hypothetical protein